MKVFTQKSKASWKFFPIEDLQIFTQFAAEFAGVDRAVLPRQAQYAKGWLWVCDSEVLGLWHPQFVGYKPFYLDLDAQWQRILNNQHNNNLKQPLAKAIAAKTDGEVVDATAGQLGDSLLFLYWGKKVLAYEENFAMYALIQNALRRVTTASLQSRMKDLSLFHQRFTVAMARAEQVIYYDPMFEKTSAKTKTKAGMEMMRSFIMPTEHLDPSELQAGRCVVKRALRASEMETANSQTPAIQFKGKAVRYDVYLPL